MEPHHSALENTKATMINTINGTVDCASTCSRIYSRALDRVFGLLPSKDRGSIQEKMDREMNSHALVSVDYYNWFFNGKPSPLYFGIGTLPVDFPQNLPFYHAVPAVALLKAEQTDDLGGLLLEYITLFEVAQYGPVLPLNSQEVKQLIQVHARRSMSFKSEWIISRRDLVAIMVPDEPVWEPLGLARRKELLKNAIGNVAPYWLTLCSYPDAIVDTVNRKWDFETDTPKSREK